MQSAQRLRAFNQGGGIVRIIVDAFIFAGELKQDRFSDMSVVGPDQVFRNLQLLRFICSADVLKALASLHSRMNPRRLKFHCPLRIGQRAASFSAAD